MVIMASGIARGRVRTTRTTTELPNMAAILQPIGCMTKTWGSRKLRPRKLRPQTSDPENSDPENSDPENSDPENSDPENSDPPKLKKKIVTSVIT